MSAVKTCSECRASKPLTEFGRKGAGLRACCKVCHRAANAIDRERHPERVDAARRRWGSSPKKRAYDKGYAVAHSKEIGARVKRWKEENREHVRARDAAFYAANREERSVYAAAHYRRTHMRAKARAKAWRLAKPAAFKACVKRRRARLRGARGATLTARQWAEILEVFGKTCAYCLRRDVALTQDHVLPVSCGGAHAACNVVPACDVCNKRKWARGPLVMLRPGMVT